VNVPYTTGDTTAWRADVNGRATSIMRANGIAQAVAVPAGRTRVELRFWSWPAFVGVVVSAATAAALLLYAAGALPRGRWTAGTRMGAVAALALCVCVWVTRVYAGEGWGTIYTWTGAHARP
jgi:hypothetical protein